MVIGQGIVQEPRLRDVHRRDSKSRTLQSSNLQIIKDKCEDLPL